MVDALRAVSTFSDFDLGAPERLDEAGPSAESAALEQADTAPSDAFAGRWLTRKCQRRFQ